MDHETDDHISGDQHHLDHREQHQKPGRLEHHDIGHELVRGGEQPRHRAAGRAEPQRNARDEIVAGE
jgi:hypothetical protein